MKLYGIQPSRRRGQNFLVHQRSAEAFIESARFDQQRPVVEIGPGLGAITSLLVDRFPQVVVLEFDRRIAQLWRDRSLPGSDRVELIEADATSFDFSALHKQLGQRLQLMGNLPFNVSTLILLHLLHNWRHVECCHLTFQKEVADRLIALPGTKAYGSLTIQLQMYAKARKSLSIKKGEYFPMPKVDSTVVTIDMLPEPMIARADCKPFEAYIRNLFLYRRKTMPNAVKIMGGGGEQAEKMRGILIDRYGNATLRSDTLSVEEHYAIWQEARGFRE